MTNHNDAIISEIRNVWSENDIFNVDVDNMNDLKNKIKWSRDSYIARPFVLDKGGFHYYGGAFRVCSEGITQPFLMFVESEKVSFLKLKEGKNPDFNNWTPVAAIEPEDAISYLEKIAPTYLIYFINKFQ
jgi:hypothetical protein